MSFVHFLSGLFVCFDIDLMSFLYILEIDPSLITSYENIFSHSMDFLLALFMVSFDGTKAEI